VTIFVSEAKCPITGKKNFASKFEADAFAARQKLDYPHETLQVSFQCAYPDRCKAWHLTREEQYTYSSPQSSLGGLLPAPEAKKIVHTADVRRLVAAGYTDAGIRVELNLKEDALTYHLNRIKHQDKEKQKHPGDYGLAKPVADWSKPVWVVPPPPAVALVPAEAPVVTTLDLYAAWEKLDAARADLEQQLAAATEAARIAKDAHNAAEAADQAAAELNRLKVVDAGGDNITLSRTTFTKAELVALIEQL